MVSGERLTKGYKMVHGVGVNDADYNLYEHKLISGKWKTVWTCPYYLKWASMLKYCYSDSFHKKKPTYKDCTVCEEWKTFSNFKAWMETQDWEVKCLYKDILVEGNKVYSPDTCVFVDPIISGFISDIKSTRSTLPLGVCLHQGFYKAQCSDPFKIRSLYVGVFKTPEEAHLAWKRRKHQYATELANSEYVTDERVRQALLTRYL